MKVNGIDVSEYKAELIDRAASTQVIKSITDWLDGSVQGTLLRQSYDYKSIRVTFVIKAENEDEGYKQISRLTEALKKCCVKFEDINLVFPCVLNGASVPERLQNGVFKVSYILLNDWGIGDAVTLSFDIEQKEIQEIEIKYVENWSTTTKGYTQCYEEKEIYRTIAEETVYIESGKVAEKAATASTWNDFFLALGVDIDKHKPQTKNTLNGFIHIEDEYSEDAAKELFTHTTAFEVFYNRFQKKGLADLPENTNYPSIVWTTGAENRYYFDLGVGQGWDIRDITVYVWGRWFQALTTGSGQALSGSMIGAGNEQPFNLALTVPKAITQIDNITATQEFKVFESSSTKGGHFIIETLESIAATPLRKYGFKSSNDGETPVDGYCDVIFNGITLDRVPIDSVVLNKNLTLLYGNLGTGKYCEASRIQIWYKGELIKDLIPVNGNVKNGFVNTYDTGLYDINKMEFVAWSNTAGDKGQEPQAIMQIPNAGDTPKPPQPPAPKYTVTVVSGSGSGQYEEGTYVAIEANAPQPNYEFTGWVVNTGNVTIVNPTATSTGFMMPAADVTVTAAYQEKVVEPEILYYSYMSKVTSETEMGENAGVWATTPYAGDGPSAYDSFVAVYSLPNDSGEWSIYNSSYYTKSAQGKDKFGRPYISFDVTRGKGTTGQYITYTPAGGTQVRQDFAIKSL